MVRRWKGANYETGSVSRIGTCRLLMVMVKCDEPPFADENSMVLQACLGHHILIANAMWMLCNWKPGNPPYEEFHWDQSLLARSFEWIEQWWLMAIYSHLAPKLSFPIKNLIGILNANIFPNQKTTLTWELPIKAQVTLAYKSYDTVPNTIKDSCGQCLGWLGQRFVNSEE